MMSCNQSLEALKQIFYTVRNFVNYFPDLIFEQVYIYSFLQSIIYYLRKLNYALKCAFNF